MIRFRVDWYVRDVGTRALLLLLLDGAREVLKRKACVIERRARGEYEFAQMHRVGAAMCHAFGEMIRREEQEREEARLRWARGES